MIYEINKPIIIHELGKRANQEDSVYPAVGTSGTEDRLFILCDGMGGHEHGEVASDAVITAMSQYIKDCHQYEEPFTDEMFNRALAAAYAELNRRSTPEEALSRKKMGTTLVFVYLHRGGCLAAHIGDSRYYHIRPSEHTILYRSRDHSLVNDLYEIGEISKAEMKTHGSKNVITRVMQPGQEVPAKADIVHIADIKAGDIFYLCSDGMLETMDDEEILDLFCEESTLMSKRARLMELSEDNHDNHTAIIVQVERVMEEPRIDGVQPNDEAIFRAANKALNDPGTRTTSNMAEDHAEQVSMEGVDISIAPNITEKQPPRTVENSNPSAPHKQNKWFTTILSILIAIILGLFAYIYLLGKKENPANTIRINSGAREETVERGYHDNNNAKSETETREYTPNNKRTNQSNADKPDKEKKNRQSPTPPKSGKENGKTGSNGASASHAEKQSTSEKETDVEDKDKEELINKMKERIRQGKNPNNRQEEGHNPLDSKITNV